MPNAPLRRFLLAASFATVLAVAMVGGAENARAVLSSGSTDMLVRGTAQQRLTEIPSDTTDPALRLERDSLVGALAILDETAVNDGLLDDLADLKRIASIFQTKKVKKLIPDAQFISVLTGLAGNLRSAQEVRLNGLETRLDGEDHPRKVRKQAAALLAAARSALQGAANAGLNNKGALSKIGKAVKALDAAEKLLGDPQIVCEPSIEGSAVGTGPDGMSSTDDWTVPTGLASIGSSEVSGVLAPGGSDRLDVTATFGGGRFTLTVTIRDTVVLEPSAQIALTGSGMDVVQVTVTDRDAFGPNASNTWNSMTGSMTVVQYDANARALRFAVSGRIAGGTDDQATMGPDESVLFLSSVAISVCDWTDASQ